VKGRNLKMATKFKYVDKNGVPREGTAYTMQEKLQYHSERAKNGSVNPKTGKHYSDVQRAKSRGYLTKASDDAKVFNLKKADKERKKAESKAKKKA